MATPDNIQELMQNSESGITYECKWIDTDSDTKRCACYFCVNPLNNMCYAFVQLGEHYAHDIMFLACNDQCPVAMQSQSISTCYQCKREYIHNRYDSDVCVICSGINNKK